MADRLRKRVIVTPVVQTSGAIEKCPAARHEGGMTPKRHGRSDTGCQLMLANTRHDAFFGKDLNHRHDVP